ncbi:response regulator [Halobacteriales archaeon QH_6_68_27]|nr:MAG: response regulator [Halobacteriales archaeon QH_6_68_27]
MARKAIVTESSENPTVLVVDDEAEVADVYALRLRGEYDVETAHGGAAALDTVDDSFDVVLLDRRMPDIPGDDVLSTIRDRGLDCRVIMITAVDPDFDIVEMPFDDYLCKPVEKRDLVAAIEQQLTATRYDERLTEYLEVTSKLALLEAEKSAAELDGTSKLALLEAEKSAAELDGNEQIGELRDRADRLKADLDETLAEFDDATTAFQEIERNSS